jgi:FkbM family methyltransferase
LTLVSFAQNGEDVVLARAFGEHVGFYVDVGASDPVVDSVTKHFYDHGWSGINVEPASLVVGDLRDARPRDLTLELALAASAGTATFYELPREQSGNSALSKDIAQAAGADRDAIMPRDIRVTTLADLWDEHVGDRTVDFLKIDVEGAEAEVLAGADFVRHRPRVVVVEATRPGTSEASHEAWEEGLLAAGYRLSLFDGLNRFYARTEDEALVPALSVPANVLDDYVPFRYRRWGDERDRMESELSTAQTELVTARTDLVTARTDAERWANRAAAHDAALQLTRQELARSQAALHDARAQLDAAHTALDDALASRQ